MIRALMVVVVFLVSCSPSAVVLPTALEGEGLKSNQSEWMAQAERGRASADLYFNLGHTYYASGDMASAIAFWRAGRVLAPRDGVMSHNLALARTELPDAAKPVEPLVPWTEILTPDELGLFAVGLVFVGVGLIRVRRRPLGTVLLLLGLSIGYPAGNARIQQESQPVAVVIGSETELRETPRIEARRIARVHVGTELRAIERQGAYVLVRGGDDLRGWIPRERLRVVLLR